MATSCLLGIENLQGANEGTRTLVEWWVVFGKMVVGYMLILPTIVTLAIAGGLILSTILIVAVMLSLAIPAGVFLAMPLAVLVALPLKLIKEEKLIQNRIEDSSEANCPTLPGPSSTVIDEPVEENSP